jgi:hypothetical protein
MFRLRTGVLPLVVALTAVAVAVVGCAPVLTPPGGGGPASSAQQSSAKTSPPRSQNKFDGVPKACLSADDVTISIHEALPQLNPTAEGSALNCTYYVDGSTTSPAVNITYVPLNGVTVAAWAATVTSKVPSAKPIAGVGDGAFTIVNPPLVPSGITFVSNGIECTAYTDNFAATTKQLTTLAESILEG